MSEYIIIIGNQYDLEFSPEEDIVAVCSCIHKTTGEIIRYGKPFLGLDIGDYDSISPSQFDNAIQFIDKYIERGNVQVACKEGQCRSVSVAFAYYLLKGFSYDQVSEKLGRSPVCWSGTHTNSLSEYVRDKGRAGNKTRVKRRF